MSKSKKMMTMTEVVDIVDNDADDGNHVVLHGQDYCSCCCGHWCCHCLMNDGDAAAMTTKCNDADTEWTYFLTTILVSTARGLLRNQVPQVISLSK